MASKFSAVDDSKITLDLLQSSSSISHIFYLDLVCAFFLLVVGSTHNYSYGQIATRENNKDTIGTIRTIPMSLKDNLKKFLTLNLLLINNIWSENFPFYHKACFPRKT